jgi:hypothetical protein
MSEKVTKIHEFDPKIYPRLVWVVVGAKLECLQDMFGPDVKEMDECALAEVSRVGRKKPDNRGGVLIRFRSKKDMTTAIIAHESSHAAIDIFDYCECCISTDNQEPFAYLVEFCADCCNQVKTGKFK